MERSISVLILLRYETLISYNPRNYLIDRKGKAPQNSMVEERHLVLYHEDIAGSRVSKQIHHHFLITVLHGIKQHRRMLRKRHRDGHFGPVSKKKLHHGNLYFGTDFGFR